MIRVRFAPTPSGPLFVSGARVALANYLFARRGNGRILLRWTTSTRQRCPPANAEQMMQDLRWFGLDWDEVLHQSERLSLYQAAISRLKKWRRAVSLLRIRRRTARQAGIPPQAQASR